MIERLCDIESCCQPHLARGWCRSHYYRWKRHGSPTGGFIKYSTTEESFAARTEWRGACLEWTGSITAGYGRISLGGGKIGMAHRYAYSRVHGHIPENLVIDHICRNKACCNVEHLRLATPGENMQNLSGPRKDSTSGYLGVFWSRNTEKWMVRVGHEGKRHYGGLFKCKEEANLAAITLRKRFYTHNEVDRA